MIVVMVKTRFFIPLMLAVSSLIFAEDPRTQRGSIISVSQEGRVVRVNDGRRFEIAPYDRVTSLNWLANPGKISVSESEDEEYPLTVTNEKTDETVNARYLSKQSPRRAKHFNNSESKYGEHAQGF